MTTEQYSIGYDAGYQDGFDAALAEPVKQEPVAWLNPHNQAVIDARKKKQIGEGKGYPNFSIPLYAAPVFAKREWVDLTLQELQACCGGELSHGVSVHAAIAAFKGKNK